MLAHVGTRRVHKKTLSYTPVKFRARAKKTVGSFDVVFIFSYKYNDQLCRFLCKKKQTKIKFKTGSYAYSIAYFIFSHMLIGREPFQKGRLYLVKNVFAIIWPS